MLKFIICLMGVFFCSWSESSLVIGVLTFLFLLFSSLDSMVLTGFEMNSVSWSLSLLSFWLILLSIFSSSKIYFYNKLSKFYLQTMLFLLLFLIITFFISDFLLFYVSFEICLLPILLMILGWGYQPERLNAGLYMFFYTLLGSLPLLFCILYLGGSSGGSYMYSFSESMVNSLLMVFLVGAFLVKFPMYGVHLWLLKAHVEAPVAGSMILAGVLLKLGGYGLMRFSSFFLSGSHIIKELIICLSLWGGVVLSLMCLRFMDMKLLIAASSVVHMSGCISGIFILSEWGFVGCLVMMLAHGLCSSGLFCLANMIYERTSSRSMYVNKGLLNLLPSFSLWWFLLVVSNMAGPPSYNLAGEIMILVSIVNWCPVSVFVLFMLGFFSAAYSLYLYSLSQHGVYVKIKSGMKSGLLFEYFVLFLHWLPLNVLILNLNLIMLSFSILEMFMKMFEYS